MAVPTLQSYRAADPFPQKALERALLFAAYWRLDEPLPALDIGLQRADLQPLLAGWGRPGDTAVVAGDPERPIGAAWFRLWTDADHSYGYVDSETPELGIGIQPTARRQGLGRRLLEALIREGTDQKYARLSLSVESDNPACHLYHTMGFRVYRTEANGVTMVRDMGAERGGNSRG